MTTVTYGSALTSSPGLPPAVAAAAVVPGAGLAPVAWAVISLPSRAESQHRPASRANRPTKTAPCALARSKGPAPLSQCAPSGTPNRSWVSSMFAVPLVQRGHLALQALWLLAVPLAQRHQLRGQPGLGGLPAQRAQAERHEQEADRHREDDDRGDGGQPAEGGREDTGQPGDKVVRGVHRDAKETRHGKTAFQLRGNVGWRRPRGPRDCYRERAAARAAEGALGLDRPAASGSRWRKNAARQDFSRRADVRRIIGSAAVVRERLAAEVSRASTAAASTAPARTAAPPRASAVRPEGLVASWVTSCSNPVSMASTASAPPSTVIAFPS